MKEKSRLENEGLEEIEQMVENVFYYWVDHFSKMDFKNFDMITVILFLHTIKPWEARIEALGPVRIFPNF